MFHEVRFPTTLSFGALGGSERRTQIVTLANGFEERNTPWAHGRRRYDAGLGLRSLDDIAALIAFFEARQGQLIGFRWKDWSDFKSCLPSQTVSALDQPIGFGDDATTSFQLTKTYRSGEASYVRPITKPVTGTVKVAVGGEERVLGAGVDVDLAAGVISFVQPPAEGEEIRAGFEFDVPVRFDADRLQTSLASFQAGEVPQVPVVEIRV